MAGVGHGASPTRSYGPPPSPAEPQPLPARTASTGGSAAAARLPGQQRPPGKPAAAVPKVRQRPASKMKLLQQQLDAHEELSASLKTSPVRVSRVPAERDGGAEEVDRQMMRRWQWLKAAEVGVWTHLVMLWDQEQLDPLLGGLPLLAHSNEHGDTALHRCAALGHQDCVEWLLQRGADPEVRNQDGESAADLADATVEHLLVVEPRPAPSPSPSPSPSPAPPPVLAPALARRTNRTPAPAPAAGRAFPLMPPPSPAMEPPNSRLVSDGAVPLLSQRATRIFDALDSQLREVIELEAVRPYVNGPLFQQLQSVSPYGEIDKHTWEQIVATGDPSSCSAMLDDIERAMRSQPQLDIYSSTKQPPLQSPGKSRTNSSTTYMTAGPEPSLMDADWNDESALESPAEYRPGQHQPHNFASPQVAMPIAPVPLDSHDHPVTGLALQGRRGAVDLTAVDPPRSPASKDPFGGTEVYHQKDNICERSCFIFREHGVVRRTCRKIIASRGSICCRPNRSGATSCCEVSYFESFSILLIALNSLFLAMYDPLNPGSDWNNGCDTAGNIFTILFSGEMAVKMIAQGVIKGEGSYMKDGFWNWLDLLVVGTGYLDVFGIDNQFGVLRTVRLLRPLRTIGAIKGLRQQVEVLMQRKTLENIANVCLLMFITFSVFSIVGVRLFAGRMRSHCYDVVTMEVVDEEAICMPDFDTCEEGSYCSETDPVTGELNPNPAYDILGFEDFGSAMLTVFVCTTLEGWTDVMYMVQDGYSSYAWVYFVLLIICGSIIIINLFLAVISQGYEDSMAEEMEEKRFHKMAVQCIEMLKLVVHDAIIQPTGVKCRIGQRVQLNEPAARRLEARNRSSIHNLTWDPLNTGTVKAVREGGRVRVQTEDGKMVWHDTANLVPLGLGPTSPAVGLSPREHDEKDKVDWEDVERQAKNIDVRISAFLRMFEVHDYQNDDVRVMTYDEFHEGLIRFHKFCELQAEPGVEQELPHAVYVADEAVRAMLLLLAYDNPKGRDKKWQDDMLHMIFVSMDEDMDHSLSQGEFYDCFVHPQLSGEDDMEEHISAEELSNENLRGKSAVETLNLYCQFLSNDANFNHFITFMVLFNCTVLALDYHNMPKCGAVVSGCVLDAANTVCTFVFMIEMMIKLRGLGYNQYLSDRFNVFDGTIVMFSVLEFFLPGDGGGVSVFRALRILRIFKAAARFENLKKVIMTIVLTLPELANFFILLSLAVFFYAVMGLQLYGGTYGDLEEYPRVNFDSFWWSLMTVFQVLTGEDWNAAMFDAMEANGSSAAVFFISLTVIGGYIMLNLFLAVLLMKTSQAFEKPTDMRKEVMQRAHKENYAVKKDIEVTLENYDRLEGSSFFMLSKHSNLRKSMRDIVRNKSFDNTILACIMVSSLALALEEPGSSPELLEILDYMDYGFTIVFLIEMTLKIAVLNFYFGATNAYLKDPWNVLDFCVVCASVMSRVLDGDTFQWIKALRVLRALRPLRVIQRVPELKMVVNSLFKAIPIIANVIVLLGMFWLIFGILGVQLFKGQFYACTDGEVLLQHACSGTFVDAESGEVAVQEWVPPEWGFDNIVEAVITLFEVSTLERWLDIMYLCIDAVGVGHAPVELHSPMMGLFFITFIMFGSFFMLELFVSAIVAAYTMMNEESDGNAFQSERQRRVVSKMVIGTRSDDWTPRYEWQEPIYHLISSTYFDNSIILLIVLNTVTMALYSEGMDKVVEDELDFWNSFFTVLFLMEAVTKLVALGVGRYFNGPNSGWNCFDFTVVAVTTTELMFTIVADQDDTIPGATVLRVFRIARIFRLLAKFKGLTNLFLAIMQALPTIMNVGTVLFLVYFIYAILAMNLFGKVKRGDFLSDRANFETFGVSLLTMFRMSTGESWNGIMMDCRVKPPDCEEGVDCGNHTMAPLFFISFQVFGQYVMLNLFVAVMLEFYQRQQEACDQFLDGRDRKVFEDTWAGFIGRDYKKPYRNLHLMPAELLDAFMSALPPRLGWTVAERTDEAAKREAYKSIGLPTRAMKVLVPWTQGKHWTRSGMADLDWQEAKNLAEEDALEEFQAPGAEPIKLPARSSQTSARSGASDGIDEEEQVMQDRGDLILEACKEVEERAEEQEAEQLRSGTQPPRRTGSASAETTAVWKYLRQRAKTAGILPAKIEAFGRDQDGVGGDKEGLLSLLKMTEMCTEQWSQRLAKDKLTEQELSELMKLYDSGDIDDYLAPLQLHALRPRQAKELLMSRGVWSRVSVQEHHYYHFDEVWHAIYNRAERRHLMDPENLDFKDDETKNRRLNLFKSIMETTAKEIDKQIREEVSMDTGVTMATLGVEPLTPRHIYSAMKVQRMLVQKRRDKKFKLLQSEAVKASRTTSMGAGPSPEGPNDGGMRRRLSVVEFNGDS